MEQQPEGRVLRSRARSTSTPIHREATPLSDVSREGKRKEASKVLHEEEDDEEFSDASLMEVTVIGHNNNIMCTDEPSTSVIPGLGAVQSMQSLDLQLNHTLLESLAKQVEQLSDELRLSRERERSLQSTLEAMQEGIRTLTAMQASAPLASQGSARTKRSRQQRSRRRKQKQQQQQRQEGTIYRPPQMRLQQLTQPQGQQMQQKQQQQPQRQLYASVAATVPLQQEGGTWSVVGPRKQPRTSAQQQQPRSQQQQPRTSAQ
ncbi:putative uncharacterized protein DDB_G0274435 [Anopheles moucheti]|uniref:putative uncharacterized protein DDB_G0274435 n=1 Tax=Anopheles moucheti TaxID=186751 RepID=UPI0022F1230E|nr:putative uncharacterized protein DDB_G0274435 [Anopheles moucheti]